MSSSAVAKPFFFGFEIELLMGSRKKQHSSWLGLANELSGALARSKIPNRVQPESDDDYTQWSIVQEVTIEADPGKNLYGVELVSPKYSLGSSWKEDVVKIFRIINSAFRLGDEDKCSTHVHISSMPLFPPGELAKLCKGIVYFEGALDQLIPASRRGSSKHWCRSNKDSRLLSSLPLAQCFGAIDKAVAGAGSNECVVQGLIDTLNLYPFESSLGLAMGMKKDFVHGKVYKWNLTGLATHRGDVEFRQPPGSVNADSVHCWVELTLCFVAGVVCAPGFNVTAAGANLSELRKIVDGGAILLGFREAVATQVLPA